MATTLTTRLKLAKPAVADRNWGPVVNGNADALDGLAPLSALAVAPAEVPSTSLNVAVAPGPYLAADGSIGSYAGGTVAATASATSYVSLDPSNGAVSAAAAWPVVPHVRLAVVIADATTITSVTDARCVLNVALAPCLPLSGGTMADGADIAMGTTTGTKIGTATTQKLGFFNATPVARPSVPAATATGTWGTTEKDMLNAVHSAIRALGLGG